MARVTRSLPRSVKTGKNNSDWRRTHEIQNAPVAAAPPATAERDAALRQAAVKLEARFLSEMLKSSGLDGSQTEFSGGIGEEQFRSFLRDAQADAMARTGGVGLAESLFQALKARDHG